MKKISKRNLFAIISVCICCLIIIIMITSKYFNSNDSDNIKIKFDDKFLVSEEKYYNDENNFYFSAKIYGKSDTLELIECIHMNILDESNNILIGHDEMLGGYISKESYYPIDFTYSQQVNNISKIEYNLCE